MIGYLEGKILKKEEDRVLVLANQIGYEVLLPAIVMKSLQKKNIGEEISLYIFFQQTERQPKPVLIGFNLEVEKEFFQHFISVEAIGPLKAVRALDLPVREIAAAIESGEIKSLRATNCSLRSSANASRSDRFMRRVINRTCSLASWGPGSNFSVLVADSIKTGGPR